MPGLARASCAAGRPDGPTVVTAPSDEGALATIVERTLAARPLLGPVRLICVDGPAGSGKTTLAARLVGALGDRGVSAGAVHMDDVYDGWTGLEGSCWRRLSAQVLEPLRRGRAGRLQRYDWGRAAFADWVDVPVPDVLVLEGCGAARRAADAVATLRVWVEAPDDLRLARGLARDGAAARAHWDAWMRDEAAHYAREGTRGRADVRLDAFGRMNP